MGILIVNGTDLETLGVQIGRGLQGWRDGIQATVPTAPMPGRAGGVPLSRVPTLRPRRFVASGHQTGTSVSDLVAKLDQLKWTLRIGELADVPFHLIDDASREWVGRAQLTVRGIGPDVASVKHAITIAFLCDDPTGRDTTDTVVDFTSLAQLPMGTASAAPVLRLGEGATNPVVTYRDSSGVVQGSLGLTATLGAGAWVDVDCLNQTIVDQAGANRASYLTSGDFLLFDPADAEDYGGPYPTLEVAGGGTLNRATYRRRWA